MTRSFGRRALLAGGLASVAAASLTACAGGTPGASASSGGASVAGTTENPFGVAKGSAVDAVIFNGGYKTDYVDFAAELAKKKVDLTYKVTPSNQIAQELQPRFVGGTPPDLVDNAGANQIGMSTIVDQLEDLSSLLETSSYEGAKLSETLYLDAIKRAGTYNGKLVALNYVMTVYGVWYSASLFQENGWTPPKTWAEAMELGAKAKAKGKYLFLFGKEAATYYLTMMLDSAIKEGGDEVRLSIEKLDKNCYSQQPVIDVFKAVEDLIKAGYMKPGGSGTQFTAAQAQWSQSQEALLYPSGGWIENEMKKQTKDGFEMTAVPSMQLSTSAKMPYEALRAAPGEPFIVPAKGKNVAGGKEILRAMLSTEAATNFTKTRLSPTVVKDLVPEDGFGSSALKSQSQMLKAAGNNIFDYRSIVYYGLNKDNLVVFNSFLEGKTTADEARKQLQEIVDKAANDPNVKKLEVS